MRDVRGRLAPPASRFVAPLLACCAGKRLRVSSAPHPCGFESHALGPKKKGLHHWRSNKSMVGDGGCRVRLRRPLPLRACGPRVLRWKTLARFLSSAPLRVRIPLRWAHTKTVPFRGPFPIRWWAMRDVACGFAARFRFVASLLACFAGKRFAFPQLRTLPGSNPMCWAQKERPPSLEA